MKYVIILIFFTFNLIFAKDTTLVKDDFLDNRYNWLIYDNDSAKSEILNSNLFLRNKSKVPNFYYTINYQLNASQMEYQLKLKINILKCDENKGIGIIICKNGLNQFLVFRMNKLNYYKLSYHNNGKYKDLIEYRKYDFKIQKDNYLDFKFICKINSLEVFIDDNKVINLKDIRLDGSEIGFVLPNDSKVAIDEFSLKLLNQRELNIIPKINKKENLGQLINSKYYESACLISPDGSILYVTRKNHPDNYGNKLNDDDVWFSNLDSNGNWTLLKNIGKPINNFGFNNVVSSSVDNNTLYLLNHYDKSGNPNGQGVSKTIKSEKGWSIPQNIQIDSFYNKNTYSAYCFSANQNILISSIEDEKSYGELDLYVSFKKDDDTFTKPKNLGKIVNTKSLDFNPFLASDNKTLYFSTLGREGFGSADIYVSKRLDDTWENWSIPQNMGEDVNSEYADLYYSVPISGDYAYLITEDKVENAQGLSDVCRIKIRDKQKPNSSKLFSGKVVVNGEPFSTKVYFESLKDSSFNGFVNTNPNNGEFKIALPFGDKYTFYFNDWKSNKSDLDQFVLLNENKIDTTKVYSFKFTPDKVFEKYTILFDFGKHSLNKKQKKNLIEYLESNQIKNIEIYAHTDSIGSEKANLILSNKRAKSIEKALKEIKIDFKVFAKGESEPIKPNSSKSGRAFNRRVEIIKK